LLIIPIKIEPTAKKAMPKMQKVKTTDIDIDIEDEEVDGDKDSYGTNTANTASQEEMTSLNNDSAEDDGDYH
jgi:hypothetical protein